MTYIPEQRRMIGVFGEQVTSHRLPIVQLANKYRIDPALLDSVEIFEATGGSADNNENLFRCQTGTSLGGYGVVRTVDTLNYRAGQGVEAILTASFTTGIPLSLQFGGMFSLTETVAFGYDGADFSVIYSYDGAAEVQLITVTATGAGTCTVTLDDDAVGITVTNTNVQANAEELRAGLVGDATLSAKWRFEQVDDKVFCIAKSVGDKTGAFTISGGVTASIAEQTTGKAKTDAHVAQDDWNVSTSPFTSFDPTKLNVYKIEYGYLGAANIEFHIYNPDTGEFVKVHSIKSASTSNTTNLGEPNLKVGWTSASLGSTGTNLTVEGGSAAMFLQGDEVIKEGSLGDDNIIDSTHPGGVIGTTLRPILTIKNRVVYGDRFNLGKVFPLQVSVNNEHNKGLIVELYKDATVSGSSPDETNFQYEDEYNSLVIIDKTSDTITGGSRIDAFTVGANDDKVIDLSLFDIQLLPECSLTLAAKTIATNSTSVTGAITWKEEK